MSGTSQNRQSLLERLVAAISRLARPADAQIAYLESLGPGDLADELALELDDVVEAALAQPGLLTKEQAARVRQLDSTLEQMGGADKAELWTYESLRSSPQWAKVRELARSALRELHADSLVSG